jgi:hypothetical protein
MTKNINKTEDSTFEEDLFDKTKKSKAIIIINQKHMASMKLRNYQPIQKLAIYGMSNL